MVSLADASFRCLGFLLSLPQPGDQINTSEVLVALGLQNRDPVHKSSADKVLTLTSLASRGLNRKYGRERIRADLGRRSVRRKA